MQCSLRALPLWSPLSATYHGRYLFCRHASLTGAINRGIRKSKRGVETFENRTAGRSSYNAEDSSPWQSGRKTRPDDQQRVPANQRNDRLLSSDRRDGEAPRSRYGPQSVQAERSGGRSRPGQQLANKNAYGQARTPRSSNHGQEHARASKSVDDGFMEKHVVNRRERRAAIYGEPYTLSGDQSSARTRERRSEPSKYPRQSRDDREPSDQLREEKQMSLKAFEPALAAQKRIGRGITSGYGELNGFQKSRRGSTGQDDRESFSDSGSTNKYSWATRSSADERGRSGPENPETYEASDSRGRKTRKDGKEWDRDTPRNSTFSRTPQPHVKVPLSIPYTTAGSEFLYGTFVVKAALRSGRRKLYKLYIYHGPDRQGGVEGQDHGIHKLALAAGVEVSKVTGEWDKLLYKMSDQRPHNGYVLEASPVPKLPITALESVSAPSETFNIRLGHQSAEDLAVNSTFDMSGSQATLPSVGGSRRYPLALMLDSIKDPGNLGAIIRSAYFLGLDAIVLIEHGTAPISPVVLKASAGAAEYLPLLTVKNEHAFMKLSQENGWKFFAATSPDSTPRSGGPKPISSSAMTSALDGGPCVLLLGSEGEGIRPQLQKIANGVVGIESARGSQQGLDSLNVSVAAALLMKEFLRSPGKGSTEARSTSEEVKPRDAEKVF